MSKSKWVNVAIIVGVAGAVIVGWTYLKNRNEKLAKAKATSTPTTTATTTANT